VHSAPDITHHMDAIDPLLQLYLAGRTLQMYIQSQADGQIFIMTGVDCIQ
jgi:hypothetical protein